MEVTNCSTLTQHNIVAIFNKGGEIDNSFTLKDDEELVIIKKDKQLTPEQKVFLNNRNELKNFTSNLGGYIHMFYVKNELLFNKVDIDRADIARLIYLSTYIDYNDRQENLLVKHGEDNKVEALKRNDIKKLLTLSDRAFLNFIKNMLDLNMIFECEGKYYMNNEYFSKGNVDIKGDYTRIFINTTRILFENCTVRQHRQLGYVYQLIPYIDYETNTLMNSNNERFNFRDVAELVGIDVTTRQNISKFKKELYKFKIDYNGGEYYIFKGIIEEGYGCKREYFVINPILTCRGNKYSEIENTINKLHFIG